MKVRLLGWMLTHTHTQTHGGKVRDKTQAEGGRPQATF